MSFNTSRIIKDADLVAVPQYFNQGSDMFEPVLGELGAILTKATGTTGEDIVSNVYVNSLLGISSTVAVLDLTTPVVFDFLQLFEGQSPADVRWLIQLRKKDTTLQYVASILGSYISFQDVANTGHHLFDVSKCDTNKQAYSMQLKRQLICPYGIKIEIQNQSATLAKVVSASYVYRQAK